MNNPYNLSHAERAITPTQNFNQGINTKMSKARRKAKQVRYKANELTRQKIPVKNGNNNLFK